MEEDFKIRNEIINDLNSEDERDYNKNIKIYLKKPLMNLIFKLYIGLWLQIKKFSNNFIYLASNMI